MKRGDEYRALKERIGDALLAEAERRVPGTLGARRPPGGLDPALDGPLHRPSRRRDLRAAGHARPLRPPVAPGAARPVPGLYLAGADALMLGIGGAVMSGLMCTAAIAGMSTFGRLSGAARTLGDPTVPRATPSATSPSIA